MDKLIQPFWQLLGIIVFSSWVMITWAAGDVPIALEKAHFNTRDRASILRGAKFYAQYCMVCHTMRYLEHNTLAKEAGVTLDKMPLKQKEWAFGIVPPDLTLIARQHSADWIYTYLHAFYKDDKRPTGSNNLLAKEINMPNPFLGLQGEQILTKRGKLLLERPEGYHKPAYYSVLELVRAGSMSPAEFNSTMNDLVNFFVYAADPGRIEHQYIGLWVVLFLVILFVFAYYLKKAYWKDIKK